MNQKDSNGWDNRLILSLKKMDRISSMSHMKIDYPSLTIWVYMKGSTDCVL